MSRDVYPAYPILVIVRVVSGFILEHCTKVILGSIFRMHCPKD